MTAATPTPKFVSFEGVEGVGKTTAITLFAELLDSRGIDYVRNREPGGTPVAEALRDIVLGEHTEALSDTTELLLMFAARAQSMAQVIRPALARGQWVLCDRFTDATLAYQGYARGLPIAQIETLAEWVHGDCWPDATVWLHVPETIAQRRMDHRGRDRDRIEQQPATFFRKVAEGYATLAARFPERYYAVDTSADLPGVKILLNDVLDQIIGKAT